MLCAITTSSEAQADRIKKLTKRLANSSSQKVRISAALSLAKTSNARAISALSQALLNDRDTAIRRISAASLGQHLQGSVKNRTRQVALASLRTAAKKDRSKAVRATAKVALSKAGSGSPTELSKSSSSKRGKARGVLVGVAIPKNLSRRLPKNTANLLQSSVKRMIRESAPSFVKTAPGTGMPSSQQLRKSNMAGFSVVPNISKLKLIRKGKRTMVHCEIKMRLAPWAGEAEQWVANRTATVTGSGTVLSGSSKGDIKASSESCIAAVVKQVTTNQVVPFLVAKGR